MAPRGHLAIPGDIFDVTIVGAPGIQWALARDGKQPMPGKALHDKNDLASDVSGAEVESHLLCLSLQTQTKPLNRESVSATQTAVAESSLAGTAPFHLEISISLQRFP